MFAPESAGLLNYGNVSLLIYCWVMALKITSHLHTNAWCEFLFLYGKSRTSFYYKANNASTLKGKSNANLQTPGRRVKSPVNCIFSLNFLLFIMRAQNRKCELRKWWKKAQWECHVEFYLSVWWWTAQGTHEAVLWKGHRLSVHCRLLSYSTVYVPLTHINAGFLCHKPH